MKNKTAPLGGTRTKQLPPVLLFLFLGTAEEVDGEKGEKNCPETDACTERHRTS